MKIRASRREKQESREGEELCTHVRFLRLSAIVDAQQEVAQLPQDSECSFFNGPSDKKKLSKVVFKTFLALQTSNAIRWSCVPLARFDQEDTHVVFQRAT